MKVIKDYHIHSKFSKNNHAKSSLEEIVEEAINKGLEEIAITNHGLGHPFYGIRKKHIYKLKNDIEKLNAKYPQINILFGVEANILSLSGETDLCDELVNNCDIILCGFHKGVKYKTFKDFWNFIVLNKLAKSFGLFKDKQVQKNTDAVVAAMNKYNIDILTHPGDKILVDIEQIASTAQNTNTILEINNSHTHLNTEEIKICKNYDLKYTINSDSHSKKTVGDYQIGLDRAKEARLDLDKIINLKV